MSRTLLLPQRQRKTKGKRRPQPPRVAVAICILCTGELLCPDTWARFFATARAQGITLEVYLHVSECSPALAAWCTAHDVQRTTAIPTVWASPDVTRAIMALFDAALGTGTAAEAGVIKRARKGLLVFSRPGHALLVSQASIPMIDPTTLALRCAQLGTACAFHCLAVDKVADSLRAHYGDANVCAAHTFCAMSGSGWHTIRSHAEEHWSRFCAAHPAAASKPPANALAMDEVFLSSLARMYAVPITRDPYLHYTRWNTDASRGIQCDAAWCSGILPGMLSASMTTRYWFGRKFEEKAEGGVVGSSLKRVLTAARVLLPASATLGYEERATIIR